MRSAFILPFSMACLTGCIGGSKNPSSGVTTAPALNTLAITVDSGPPAAAGAINHAYVTVKLCEPGKNTCMSVDHVLLDTGSWGLRLVSSVLTAGAVALPGETDSQGQAVEECATFLSGQTWGPVATADVTLAGETAAAVPVQILDDSNSGAPPPATCGTNGSLINGVADWSANGVLGVGVFAQDCGSVCVSATTPLPVYFGCTTAGGCTPENMPLDLQVANPVTRFASDNNGVIIALPNLKNANGDPTVQGQLTFGLATQTDNQLPAAGLTLLAADAHGDFITEYNGGTAQLSAIIDSGSDSYQFDDPTITVCTSAAWVGYYCPAAAPLAVTATNMSAIMTTASIPASNSVVSFAVDDPDTFVAGAAAFTGLAGGAGTSTFTWGLPFFFGRTIYIGFDGQSSGSFKGPYYAY